jgi:hypothetical protein
MDFEIDGDTLTVDVLGFSMDFERVNKSGAQSGGRSAGGGKDFTAQKPEHFKYDLTEDGAGVVIQYLLVPEGTSSITVKIPAKIEGYPVTEVKSLVDEDNRERIKSITFPDSVTVLGKDLLSGSGITKINLPPKITVIPFSLLLKCESVTSVKIPDGVTEIGQGAFYKCTALKEVVIPDSVTKIEALAFYYCAELTSVKLSPHPIEYIANSNGTGAAFKGCPKLSLAVRKAITDSGYQDEF